MSSIQRAIISVSDKLGLTGFARGLDDAGVQIYSTGGTRRHLEADGLKIEDISAYTEFPELMGGRLKTLHPKIFGGILCRHDNPQDMNAVAEFGIQAFELVVVNLYPFEATIRREGVSRSEAIEQIDIGGPSLVRAAAKNYKFTAIVTSPEQYSQVLAEITQSGGISLQTRSRLAAEAFQQTAAYDRAIADYFIDETDDSDFPPHVTLPLRRKARLRYGENPHQKAALYSKVGVRGASVVSARQINGKELSYNNYLDLDSALAIVRSLELPAVSVIKHNNPCGAAAAETQADACQKALDGDPTSAFGSVLAMNRTVGIETAHVLAQPGLFIEAIIAPDFEAAAVGILTTKPKWKDNVRLLQTGPLTDAPDVRHFRDIDGGVLIQEANTLIDPRQDWEVVTRAEPSDPVMDELEFAWSIVRHVKSNAIILSNYQALCGVGAGQMSRVDSVEIAIRKAADKAKGAVLASDAFFPFADSIHKAASAGVAAIIQPGGSRRDQEVIDACNEHRLAMIFTGRRHFKH